MMPFDFQRTEELLTNATCGARTATAEAADRGEGSPAAGVGLEIIDGLDGLEGSAMAALAAIGIETSDGFLRRCATPQGRAIVAAATGGDEHALLLWAHRADLLRIRGLEPRFLVMLRTVGIGTLRRLRSSHPGRLADAILAAFPAPNGPHLLPSAAVIEGWIRQAGRLEVLVVETQPGGAPASCSERSISE